MIRQAEISKTAYALGLSERTIEKDYVLTWVLHAIAQSPLREFLAFKGGTAIKKIYVPDYRFSEDLDFTVLKGDTPTSDILQWVESLFSWLAQDVNLQLAMDHQEEHQSGNFTLYLNYTGPLQAQMDKRTLKVDFSKDEDLVFPAEDRRVQSSYSDCEALTSILKVYSMKEILIEKLRSLLSRSEPRDLFDVYFIIEHQLVNVEEISFYCPPKFETKGLSPRDLHNILDRKAEVFKQYWHSRLDGQMNEIPEFDTVLRETRRILSNHF